MNISAPILLWLFVFTAQSSAIVIKVHSVTCSNIAIEINATTQQYAALPQTLQVQVNKQTHYTTLPTESTYNLPQQGTEVQLLSTLEFESPFLMSNGAYNMTLNFVASKSATSSIASDFIQDIYFSDCSTTPSSAYPSSTSDSPTQGDDINSNSGLTSGTKIGITVGVLGAALLIVIAAIALLLRRRSLKQQSSTSSKSSRYINGKWINDDRNSAELKEISKSQA